MYFLKIHARKPPLFAKNVKKIKVFLIFLLHFKISVIQYRCTNIMEVYITWLTKFPMSALLVAHA